MTGLAVEYLPVSQNVPGMAPPVGGGRLVWSGRPCPYCGRPMTYSGPKMVSREHVIPQQKFHVVEKSIRLTVLRLNVIMACRICNQEKGGRTLVEFLEWLESRDRKRAKRVAALIKEIMAKYPGDVGKYLVGEKDMSELLVIDGEPPLIEEIDRKFGVRGRTDVVFAFGDRIYAPGQGRLHPALEAHERVHCERQLAFPGGAIPWWRVYLDDRQFRLNEEVLAHRAEWRWYCAQRGADKPVSGFRSAKLYHLHQIANRLASPLYGGLVDVRRARNLIEAA